MKQEPDEVFRTSKIRQDFQIYIKRHENYVSMRIMFQSQIKQIFSQILVIGCLRFQERRALDW